jgi:hypothetical protein
MIYPENLNLSVNKGDIPRPRGRHKEPIKTAKAYSSSPSMR